MIETEWLECTDASRMIAFLLKTATARKVRLFACAWCRHMLADAPPADIPILSFVETGERYADRLASDDVRQAAWETAQQMMEKAVAEQAFERAAAARDARDCVAVGTQRIVGMDGRPVFKRDPYQCHLLRDIFGNPFRPITVPPAWLEWNDRIAPKMGKTIYDERAWEQMPMLADALEHAGCSDADFLSHCRQPRPHVRGCWVVDLVLGRK